MNDPADEDADDRARVIDQDIDRRRVSRRNEALMKFINRRNDKRRNQSHPSPSPKSVNRPAQGPKKQSGQNRVLADMRHLADETLNLRD